MPTEQIPAPSDHMAIRGRREERKLLTGAFDSAANGEPCVVLLGGPSGIGKTTLVDSLAGSIEAKNGLYLSGKFNQYNRHTPLTAWKHVMRELADSIRDPDGRWSDATNNIVRALQGRGQILVDLAPEFESLLGVQPGLTRLSANEAKLRFLDTLESVFASICTPETPVVIHIDDIHWADPWSLELMERLSAQPFLLTICSYRSDEIDSDHRVFSWSEILRTHGRPPLTIELAPLDSTAVRDVLNYLLEQKDSSVHRQIAQRAGGNPFLLLELVKTVEEAASLSELPDDVVALMSRRIEQLDETNQTLLQIASCLGHEFELHSLSVVAEIDLDECRERLLGYPRLVVPVGTEDTVDRMRFFHDRVQQAAYAGMSEDQRAGYHYQIVATLISTLEERQRDMDCEIADHYAACAHVLDDGEKIDAIPFQLRAAARVAESGAFAAARDYHQTAAELVELVDASTEALWESHHQLMKELFLAHAESEFLVGDPDEAERLIRETVSRAPDVLDSIDGLILLIKQRTLASRYQDAIDVGREALAALGLPLPTDDLAEECSRELAQCMASQPDSVLSLVDEPKATDPRILAAARVTIAIGPPCYRSNQALWSVLVPRIVSAIHEHGLFGELTYAFPAYTGLLHWLDQPDSAIDYSLAAEKIVENEWISNGARTVLWLMIGSSARHWFGSLETATDDYDRAIALGQASGNLQYAAYAFGHNIYCRFFAGAQLRELETEIKGAREFASKRRNRWVLDLTEGATELITELRKGEPSSDWSWGDFLDRCDDYGNGQVSCILSVMRTQVAIFREEWTAAREHAARAEANIHMVGTQGLLPWPEHLFNVAFLDCCHDETDAALARVDAAIDQLTQWEANSPTVFRHKRLILEAERARRCGEYLDAADFYDQARAAATANDYRQWEAFIGIRAAILWNAEFGSSLDSAELEKPCGALLDWGAESLAEAVFACHGERLMNVIVDLADSDEVADRFVRARLSAFRERCKDVASQRSLQKKVEIADQLASAAGRLRQKVAGQYKENSKLKHSRDLHAEMNKELELLVARRTEELQKLAAIVDGSFDAIVGLDSDGRVLSWNSAAESFFDYTASEAVGQYVVDLIVPLPDRESETRRIAKMESGDGRHYNANRLRKDGSMIQVSINLSPVFAGDTRTGSSMIMRDITEQQRRAAELQAKTNELVELNKTLSRSNHDLEQFAYVVSHDLQEPVRMVSSFTELLSERYSGVLDETADTYIRYAREGAIRMHRLISDLLEYARLGAQDVEAESVDLDEVVEHAVSNLDRTLTDAGAELEIGELDHVAGHSGMLVQLVQNLIGNAVKFRHADRTPVVEVTGRRIADGRFVLEVSDNGIGIPEEHQPRVFEMFQRLHLRQEYPGNGVGLAIVRRVVEIHGGEIDLESTPGEGTRFRVSLPVMDSDEAQEGVG